MELALKEIINLIHAKQDEDKYNLQHIESLKIQVKQNQEIVKELMKLLDNFPLDPDAEKPKIGTLRDRITTPFDKTYQAKEF